MGIFCYVQEKRYKKFGLRFPKRRGTTYVLPAGVNVYASCITALTAYFDPAKSYFYKRYKFRKVIQLPTETTLQYLTRLSAIIVNCDYENKDKELMDMLVQHTLSHDIRIELLKAGDTLTLTRAKKLRAPWRTQSYSQGPWSLPRRAKSKTILRNFKISLPQGLADVLDAIHFSTWRMIRYAQQETRRVERAQK
jgi:hypothetical protein